MSRGNIMHLYDHSTHKIGAKGTQAGPFQDKGILQAQTIKPCVQQNCKTARFLKLDFGVLKKYQNIIFVR